MNTQEKAANKLNEGVSDTGDDQIQRSSYLCHAGFTKGGLHSSIGRMPTSKKTTELINFLQDRQGRWTECQGTLSKRPFDKHAWLLLLLARSERPTHSPPGLLLLLHCNVCAALQGALFIELWSGARVAACEGFQGGGGMRDGHADQMDAMCVSCCGRSEGFDTRRWLQAGLGVVVNQIYSPCL
jgi:hypothetical protein